MDKFLEPIFLNEKMMLNTAAYLFKGITLEEELTTEGSSSKKGKGSLGFKFLQELISPLSVEGEINNSNKESIKSARIYTLGGLHMSVIDELKAHDQLNEVTLTPLNVPKDTFVNLDVVLKPVDFYQILEVIKLLKPLIIQFMEDFGPRINSNVFNKNTTKEIPKYDKLIEALIKSLEDDYLNSKQLEMLMLNPDTNEVIGIVDIDLTDTSPQEIKAKLNDGQFNVIGKVSRQIDAGESISMVQRTVLSKIVDLVGKAVSLNSNPDKFISYQQQLISMQPHVEKFIKLNLPGPAVRVVAMSINV